MRTRDRDGERVKERMRESNFSIIDRADWHESIANLTDDKSSRERSHPSSHESTFYGHNKRKCNECKVPRERLILMKRKSDKFCEFLGGGTIFPS